MSKMKEYYEDTRDAYLDITIDGIENGCINQNDMEALLKLLGHEYIDGRWLRTQRFVKGA